MKNVYLILIVIIGFYSCSKSEVEENSRILIGDFIEVTPVNERTTLEFSSESQLRQKIKEFSIEPTYAIRLLNENQLELSCNECDESEPTIVLYKIILFEIGGFYPAESTETMKFKRIQ